MADFQNVGNFDAGVFTPKLGGVAPSGSSFTMDAAGIASGGAFLTSELEKRDPLIRKPLTSVTYARDIPIQTDGVLVGTLDLTIDEEVPEAEGEPMETLEYDTEVN